MPPKRPRPTYTDLSTYKIVAHPSSLFRKRSGRSGSRSGSGIGDDDQPGKEGGQESQSADLDSEAEHGGIFPATAGPPEVLGVEVEEPIELLDSGFSAEAAPPAGLRLAEEGDRHFRLPAGRGCSHLKHG